MRLCTFSARPWSLSSKVAFTALPAKPGSEGSFVQPGQLAISLKSRDLAA